MRLGNFSMFMFTRGPGDDTWVSRPGGVNSADRGNFRKEGIQLHVPADAQEITFGFRLSGPNGTGWADAVRLEVIEGYQPPRPSSVPAALKAPSVGTPESNRIAVQRFHGYYCGMRQSWLTARGVYELNERSLTTMAMLPAPQGVQVALAAE